jgi:hypothetical protein
MSRVRSVIAGLLVAACLSATAAPAAPRVPAVPRRAPDFSFNAVGGKKGLRSLRGQPVVLVVSKTPKTKAFRKQLKALLPIYQEFASRKVVFVAAFSEAEGEVPSNIPFVIANNGPAVAGDYDLGDDLVVAIIGRDGNLDLITNKILPALRIREVIQNSFVVQNEARKETPKGPPAP